jgi:hypothetical protein
VAHKGIYNRKSAEAWKVYVDSGYAYMEIGRKNTENCRKTRSNAMSLPQPFNDKKNNLFGPFNGYFATSYRFNSKIK